MNLFTLVLQILLTIPLTIILNYINKKDNKVINRLLIPTFYIVLVAALLPIVKENIFLIVIFEIFVRNFYITNVVNVEKQNSGIGFIIESILSVAISLFAYNYFISQVDTVVPAPESIKPFLWFLLILYVTYLYNASTKERKEQSAIKTKKRRKEQTIMQYAKFKNQYYQNVKSRNDVINNLAYSIMIFEDSRKPKVNRKVSEYIGAIAKTERKQGIMQVTSYNHITDEESIKIVMDEMEAINKKEKLKGREQLEQLLSRYNPDEKAEIIEIYNQITEFLKK